MNTLVLDEVPGMVEALHAVQLVGGVLLEPAAARQLVVASWLAAEPAARAAAFADAADVLDDLVEHAYWNGLLGVTRGLTMAAKVLDQMSYEMRSPK